MNAEQNNIQETSSVSKSSGYYFLESRAERFVFLALLLFISAAPLLFFHRFPAHADWHSHAANAYYFKKCFWEGQLLPRWIDGSLFGYGSPKFNYYAPLFYYLFVFLELIFRNPLISMQWNIILTMILCSIFGYLYLRRHGSPVSCALAVVFIIFSPAVHMYTYNNNFPTNTLAIPFIFLTLYGIDSFDKSKDFDIKSTLVIAIGFALTVLSHLATAFMFLLLLVPYFLLNLYIHRTKKFVKNFFLGGLLGAGLAAFYLIPAALEGDLVHIEVLSRGSGWDFSKNFMYTYLDRLPSDGYYWGIFDHRYYEVSNALFCLAVLICTVFLLANIDKVKNYFKEPFRVNIAIFMFIISFLMMTPLSMFIWLMIKQMKTLQFPWRFTSLVLPFGVLVLVYGFEFITKEIKANVSIYGYRFLSYSIAALLGLLMYVDFVNVYRWYWVPEETYLRHLKNVVWENKEYQPNLSGNPNWEEINYENDFTPTIQSSSPNIDITLLKWLTHNKIFQVFSPEGHQIRLRTFYFPGWNAYIDGKLVPISMDPQTGSILFQVGAGQHEVSVKFELTPVRKTATYITLGSFLLYIFLLNKFFKGIRIKVKNIKEEDSSKNNGETKQTSDLPLGTTV